MRAVLIATENNNVSSKVVLIVTMIISMYVYVCGYFGSFSGSYFSLYYRQIQNLEPLPGNLDPLLFTLYRDEYSPLSSFSNASDIMRYTMFEKFVGLIEPYATTKPYVLDLDIKKNMFYSCEICPYDTNSGEVSSENCYVGHATTSTLSTMSFDIVCEPFDVYYVKIGEFLDTSDSSQVRITDGLALCMYVRREISTLSSQHLEQTMNAFYTLWNTSETDGQLLYGESFHSSQWFAEAHLFNAGQQDSDHIHEGQGFLYQHIKISNLFELALQSVDPSVSLPYWDYTYDSQVHDNVSMSAMFTADSFGSVRFPTDGSYWRYSEDSILDATIPDGRWANARAGSYDLFPNLINPYGYLRGPWNTNPSPYISRFATTESSLPTCSSLYTLANYTALYDFSEQAPYSPHGLTHKTVGGTYGCDVFDDLVAAGLIQYEDKKYSGICVNWLVQRHYNNISCNLLLNFP